MNNSLPEDKRREQDQDTAAQADETRRLQAPAFTFPSVPETSQTPPFYAPLAPSAAHPTEAPLLPERPPLLPNILHTLLFFGIAFLVVYLLVPLSAAVLLQVLAAGMHPHRSLNTVFQSLASDPRISIPLQALSYGVLILISTLFFTALWLRPFWETIQWNARRARRFFFPLLLVGLLTGIVIGALGNWLPMPPSPPILQDMSDSTLGAWFMLIFGITIAPMTEELAFRGFLLPALLNVFRWLEQRGISNGAVTRWIGIPASIVLTTIPFTLLHAQQVSDSWGPLLLIGLVSVVLCVVRLAMKSVACGAVVHAAYNFTLFAGVVYQTSGFEHLNKLMGS